VCAGSRWSRSSLAVAPNPGVNSDDIPRLYKSELSDMHNMQASVSISTSLVLEQSSETSTVRALAIVARGRSTLALLRINILHISGLVSNLEMGIM
jgi:hypothetical protein